MTKMTMVGVASELHDFLARYDIRHRKGVRLVIVAPTEECKWHIKEAIKRDLPPVLFRSQMDHSSPYTDVMLEGIEISVQTASKAVLV